MKIWWLASYMRSGNTWLRFLLYSYWHGTPESSASVTNLIPDIHEQPRFADSLEDARRTGERPMLVKTHYPWSPRHPHAASTVGAIVILRDPRDVLMSCMNFARVLGSKQTGPKSRGVKTDISDTDFAKTFIAMRGDQVFLSRGHGTWPDNVRSWLAFDAGPKLVLRYETMKADPTDALVSVLKHLGETEPDPERVQRAVKAASFDAMRAVEVREKHDAKAARNTVFGGSTSTMRKGHYSTNKGKTGQRLDDIAPGLDAAFERYFGDVLDVTGYRR